MRRLILLAVVGVMAVGVAGSSSAAPAVAGYIVKGTIAVSSGRFVASGSLTHPFPSEGIGMPGPARGTFKLVGAVRREVYPPNPCRGSLASGTLGISWSDGTGSQGSFTSVTTGPVVSWIGSITAGRFSGGVLSGLGSTGVPPNPCRAGFLGGAVLADAG